jgi:type I restriction enzyme S subunit
MKKQNKMPPGYKLSSLGIIPEDWDVALLDSIAKRGSGHTPDKSFAEYYNGGIKWISLADSFRLDQGLILETEYEISEQGLKNSSAVLHPAGTVLMSRDAGVGKSAVMGMPMAVSQHFITWTCQGKYDNWFLYYWLQFKKEYFERQAVGSTIKTIGLFLFKKLLVVNPNIVEQKKVATCLNVWDNGISKLQSLISQKELQKKWLMQQLLTGKKRLKGFKGQWLETQLGNLFTERNETGYFELPLLSVGASGIYPQSVSIKRDNSNDDKSKYRRICSGDIGYNTMRMWQGRSALSKLEGIVSPAYTVVSPKRNTDSMYFSYLFKTPEVVNHFYRKSQGLVEDTLNCKFRDFSIVRVFIPPTKQEQKAIANVMQTSDHEIQILKEKLGKLQIQKKGLMQLLLTGKKRLNLKK